MSVPSWRPTVAEAVEEQKRETGSEESGESRGTKGRTSSFPGTGPIGDAADDRRVREERFSRGLDEGGYHPDGGGFGELLRERWRWVLVAVAVVVLLFVLAGRVFGGGGPSAAPSESAEDAGLREEPGAGADADRVGGSGGDSGGDSPGVRRSSEAFIPVERSGVTLEATSKKGDEENVTLGAETENGEFAWRGILQGTKGEGEVLTFEGPTAAQFRRGFELPGGGEVTTGVIAYARPGQPVVHAGYERVEQGGEERTRGTYEVVDEEGLITGGFYSDERDGGEVVRTYVENPSTPAEEVYRVSFRAPEGTPVPMLVGWKAPAGVDEEGVVSGMVSQGEGS